MRRTEKDGVKETWKEKKENTRRRPDDVSRNVKIEIAISVIRNGSVDEEESESDSRRGFLQIAQGEGKRVSKLLI